MPSSAQIVRDAEGRIVDEDDSVYSPSVRRSVSPAAALVIADLNVPEPGVTLVVAAESAAQEQIQI